MDNDYLEIFKRLEQQLIEMRGYFDVSLKQRQLEDFDMEAAQPEFWADQNRAREVIAGTKALKAVLIPCETIQASLDDVTVLMELGEEESDPAQKELALAEVGTQLEKIERDLAKLEMKTLLSGQLDANNAYLSIHAGAGGTESCDWADMLFRMYRRYAESHGFKFSILDYQAGDEAGIKSVSCYLEGEYAYGYLKAERGVHRLVRISPFDSNKRRHTSFASLDVVAEVDDSIEVTIEEKDIRVDTYRASGAGGQHVNTTDSAIRITHEPTGIVVQCQAERSQHSNRQKAMDMLRARLYEYELDLQKREIERFYSAKGEIAWGGQMRSYVLQPYKMVKDLRTNTETSNVDAVLDGDLDLFIESYLKQTCRQAKNGGNE
ncbi:MAG: peptide chain release factor 2 [Kiritimatiellae bacterium]|nr:peptide chain release factor 2 [Kiritimatiellia bacterium]